MAAETGGLTSQNVTVFQWTKARVDAAMLVAENSLSDEKIAEAAGVTRTTLFRWRQAPEFAARVTEHIAELEAATLRYGIAKRRRRVAALDDRWNRLQRVIEARAEALTDKTPGGDTGLLVKQLKMVGYGEAAELVEEYAVDAGLLREMRATEEQAAKELGQWTEKREHSGEFLVRQYVGIDLEGV